MLTDFSSFRILLSYKPGGIAHRLQHSRLLSIKDVGPVFQAKVKWITFSCNKFGGTKWNRGIGMHQRALKRFAQAKVADCVVVKP